MTANRLTRTRHLIDMLMTPGLRQHLAIVGAACLVVGALVLALLPDSAAVGLIIVVVVIAHAGLLMVAGSAILRRLARRR